MNIHTVLFQCMHFVLNIGEIFQNIPNNIDSNKKSFGSHDFVDLLRRTIYIKEILLYNNTTIQKILSHAKLPQQLLIAIESIEQLLLKTNPWQPFPNDIELNCKNFCILDYLNQFYC